MKHVVFDVGDVLIALDRNKKNNIIIDFQKRNGIEIITYNDLPDNITNLYGSGKIDTTHYITSLSNFFGVPDVIVWEAEKSLFLKINTDILDAAKNIRSKANLYILSNTNEIHWKHVKRLLPIDIFLNAYPSHEIGMRKPNIETYRFIESEIKCAADDIVFIDDELDNIVAAQSAGWKYSIHHQENSRTISKLVEFVNG